MNIDPELKKRYGGIGLLIVGLLLAFIPLKWIYLIIGIGMLMVSLPNMMAAGSQLKSKHPEIITIFIRSLMNVILSLLILLYPSIISLILFFTAFVLLSGTVLNMVMEKKYHNTSITFKDYISIGLGLIILIFAIFNGIDNMINTVKMALGILICLFGVVMIVSSKPAQPDIQATLDEYERRYREAHPEEYEQKSDVIDVEYEENNEKEEN